jgi:hypothetical protein
VLVPLLKLLDLLVQDLGVLTGDGWSALLPGRRWGRACCAGLLHPAPAVPADPHDSAAWTDGGKNTPVPELRPGVSSNSTQQQQHTSATGHQVR